MPPLQRDYAYYCKVFRDVPRPLAFVDLDYFDENVRQIQQRANGKKIRVASKSVRCTALLRRILAAAAQYQGIMAFHPAEAVFLSQQGFDDILIAYPFWGDSYAEALAAEVQRGKRIYAMVDSQEQVQHLNAAAARLGTVLPLCLDIDLSSDFFGLHFGVFRSGVDQPEQAQRIAEFIASQPNVRLEGVMGYEAQIAGVQDHVAGETLTNSLVPLLKRRSIPELRQRRAAILQAITQTPGSGPLRLVNGGGTGSLESTSQEAGVTEVTAGSGFYSPTLFDGYSNFKHLPAAAFAIDIVRRPRPDLYTCLGGGYIASGSAGKSKLPTPYLPSGAHLIDNEGAGEVQTPVVYRGEQALAIGDPIFFRHAKAGELCERFTHLHLVTDGQIIESVPTYRGQGMCFI